jgi:predicted N-acetyltransferase YhbS
LTPELTPLADAPADQVEALLDAAFGADRRRRTAYRLRSGAVAIPNLSYAAWDRRTLVGTLQSWPVILRSGASTEELVMVGPVAVLPDLQRSGVGKVLMTALTGAADAGGCDAMMMIGDADYYERFGFTADATSGWRIDGPYEQHRLLARLRRTLPSAGELVPAKRAEFDGVPAFAGAAD